MGVVIIASGQGGVYGSNPSLIENSSLTAEICGPYVTGSNPLMQKMVSDGMYSYGKINTYLSNVFSFSSNATQLSAAASYQ